MFHSLFSYRENIVIKRILNMDSSVGGKLVVLSSYVHGRVGVDALPENVQMGRTACVVALSTSEKNDKINAEVDAIGRKLAMHVVASNPSYLSIADVPQEVTERETAISTEQVRAEGKVKPEMMNKVIANKVQKRLDEICLLTQNHMAEEGSPLINKYLAKVSSDLKSTVNCEAFVKWSLGSDTK
jgi:elongation factor Ts